MDCPWDRSLQGWLPVPAPGSHGRAVLFLPSSQSPRTACLGDTGHLPRQHLWLRSVAPVRSQPHQPGLPPRSCPGLPSHCSRLWPSFLIWRLVYSKAFTNSENRGAAGGRGLGVFELWCGNVGECRERDRHGCEGRRPCLGHHHSAAQHGCCVDTAVRIFLITFLKLFSVLTL